LAASQPLNTMLTQIQPNPQSFPHYKVQNDLIFYKNRIWLDPTLLFRLAILEEYHTFPLGGHMGITKTLARVQANFW